MPQDIKVPHLNGDKIMVQYPLSVAAYRKWLGNMPNLEVLGDINGPDKQIYENSLKAIFYFQPRALYEFFDQQGLELSIYKEDDKWVYSLPPAGLGTKSTRVEAEERGFQWCFEELEKGLQG